MTTKGYTKRDKSLFFTAAAIARIVGCSARTIQKAIDSGSLVGYRIGNDRRVHRHELEAWMRRGNMPLHLLGGDVKPKTTVILAVAVGPFTLGKIKAAMHDFGWEWREAANWFVAGVELATTRPAGVVIDLAGGRGDSVAAAQKIRVLHADVPLVALADEDETEVERLKTVFDLVAQKPLDVGQLAFGLAALVKGDAA